MFPWLLGEKKYYNFDKMQLTLILNLTSINYLIMGDKLREYFFEEIWIRIIDESMIRMDSFIGSFAEPWHDLSDLESLIQIQITPFERTLYVYICTQIIFAYQQSNWRIRFSFKSRMRLFQTILTENRSKLS